MKMEDVIREKVAVLRAFRLKQWCEYASIPYPSTKAGVRRAWRLFHGTRVHCCDLMPEERAYSLMALRGRFALDAECSAYALNVTITSPNQIP
jgi:hypothetical protein